ncbi:GIY-YIG nuclease family protein [Bradyrhizobium erythrophlei]|jgi:putative endonuclease|uniref:Putative endonuclease n=1 Tax=Bradyrhizobium erythrophlei TaxID=1437360 RepID=A0A1M5Y399_9BRAD|nr:GIY-YIG nuclease family protein [Bradyrhizobium erythrophlei]SHI06284.1 putative endonuclease [Bradyrhizobium erythrophlei]
MSAGTYWVYILASRRNGTHYIGVTNNLRARLEQHRAGLGSEFVKKYGVHRLLHVEEFSSPLDAIAREKQLKNWRRAWKIRLIEKVNPEWNDLSHLL